MQKLLAEKLKDLPQKPGVYIFKDAQGLALYVGKAVKLKNRVSSYFKKDAGDDRGARIQLMISQIADLDYTITDNETESLVLENNFIKEYRPKYNVRLRDDKNYLFIKISARGGSAFGGNNSIPTIEFVRKPSDRNASYFGPYTSSQAIKQTVRLVRAVFPFCANRAVSNRPCFYYHIGKCPGVCFGKIGLKEYKTNYIKKIMQFLEGRQTEILKQLQLQMKGYARARMFEKAAKIRNQIFALNRVLERQKLVYPRKIDQDVFSVYQDSVVVVNLFIIREGKLIQKENFVLENTKQLPVAEILEQFLPRYYLDASSVPREIVVPVKIDFEPLRGAIATKQSLTRSPRAFGARDGKIKILVPSRGKKLDLIKLGEQNAKQYLESTTDKHLLEEARLLSSLKELQRVLDLPNLPGRIEAYDISNIQGTNPVGSMIVFDFARPKKEDYRKFKINKKQTPDDFAMMKEVLERRFKHLSNNSPALPDAVSPPLKLRGGTKTQPKAGALWSRPDLILIDGGKGQLNAAIAAISNFPASTRRRGEAGKFLISKPIPTIGLAKRLEEIFPPGKKDPIILPQNSVALFLLQRIRDEAHRFAVKYHRHLRAKGSLSSVLDEIGGIGPAKKKLLLQKFGSASRVRTASLTEIASIVGNKLAEKIKASL